MSIKDLFNNKGASKIQKSVTSDEMAETVESSDYIEAKRTEYEQFVPPIDFLTASNFAKFGSAELYYEKAFERIHQYYPYDGTLAEKAEFHNSASYLDKHVFDNLYPRTNGYANFDGSNHYITIFGGPHTASSGMVGNTLDSTFDNSMLYNEADRRTSALEYRVDQGATVEFWLKRAASVSSEETIFDIWTGKTLSDYRKNLISGKRCSGPCKSCNADGTLLGKNHAKEWKKIYTAMRKYVEKTNHISHKDLLERQITRHWILIAANCGFRTGEQRQLRWSDVGTVKHNDKTLANVIVRAETSKVRKGRTVIGRQGQYFDRLKVSKLKNYQSPQSL